MRTPIVDTFFPPVGVGQRNIYARRFRRIFGYIGAIHLTVQVYATASPGYVQAVSQLPWRFGPQHAELADSFIFVRMIWPRP